MEALANAAGLGGKRSQRKTRSKKKIESGAKDEQTPVVGLETYTVSVIVTPLMLACHATVQGARSLAYP
jgi:hypothetical protein